MGNCETQYDDNIIPDIPSFEIIKDIKNEHRLHQIINNVIIPGNKCDGVENGLCIADFSLDKNKPFCVDKNQCGMTLNDNYDSCKAQLEAIGDTYIMCRDGYKPVSTKQTDGKCRLTCERKNTTS